MSRSLSIRGLFQVIRNHFHESQEKVKDAIRAILDGRRIFKRIGSSEMVGWLQFELLASLRMAVLEWYQETFLETVRIYPGIRKHEVISLLAKVVREVVGQLEKGVRVWGPLFFMEGDLEYMPIVYDEFQKMVVHDVEMLAWSAVEGYRNNNDRLRRILLNVSPAEKANCKALFELYAETQVFVQAQDDIFKQSENESMY